MANEPRFEVFEFMSSVGVDAEGIAVPAEATGEHGWRFRAANGKISAIGGEGFTRAEDAERAVMDFCQAMAPMLDAQGHSGQDGGIWVSPDILRVDPVRGRPGRQ